MISELDFPELFRVARVREYTESLKTFDPLSSSIKDYVLMIENNTFTQEKFDECISKKEGKNIIKYIKQDSELFNEDNITKCIEKDGNLLGYIPAKKQTLKMCKAAVKQNGLALQYVAAEFLTNEVCRAALQQNYNAKATLIDIYNRYMKGQIS